MQFNPVEFTKSQRQEGRHKEADAAEHVFAQLCPFPTNPLDFEEQLKQCDICGDHDCDNPRECETGDGI